MIQFNLSLKAIIHITTFGLKLERDIDGSSDGSKRCKNGSGIAPPWTKYDGAGSWVRQL